MQTLGCQYRANASAWMTQTIFLEWLKAFDLHVSGRKVLLIMDNFSGHIPVDQLPDHVKLQNTTVFYLPPNMTSKIQPCDAGIIRNLKAYYRRRFNRMLLQRLEDNVNDPEKVDILVAIQMVVPAWRSDVKPSTIERCYLHCNIRTHGQPVDNISADDLVDEQVILDLQSQICQFKYRNPMDVRNLLNYPDEDVTSYTPDLDDIIENHLQEESTSSGQDIDEDDDSQEVPVVTAVEAYKMVESLERFWMQQSDSNISFIASLQKMKDSVSMLRIKQMVQRNIDSFFQRI